MYIPVYTLRTLDPSRCKFRPPLRNHKPISLANATTLADYVSPEKFFSSTSQLFKVLTQRTKSSKNGSYAFKCMFLLYLILMCFGLLLVVGHEYI